jgi:hypothetical protein
VVQVPAYEPEKPLTKMIGADTKKHVKKLSAAFLARTPMRIRVVL